MTTFHHHTQLPNPGSTLAPYRRLLVTLLLMAGLTGPAHADNPGPLAQVRTTVDAILAILRAPDPSSTSKRGKITQLIAERFDFDLMAQQTLATNWRHATTEERKRFVELFTRLLQATYLGRIEAYTNEKVEYRGEKIRHNQAMVKTVIIDGNTEIPVNYKLREQKEDGAWRVYDVVIEKVSLIATYRSDYRAIVNKDGITGLLAQIKEKIHSLEKDKTT